MLNRTSILVLAMIVIASAVAASDAVLLGSGFAGRPLAIGGDVVMETNGLYDAVRDHAEPEAPRWVQWFAHQHEGGIWRDTIHDVGLVVALYEPELPGLAVVDVSDPENPVQLTELTGNHYTSARFADRVLTLGTETFILVYDLTEPAAPVFGSLIVTGSHAASRWFSQTAEALYLVDKFSTLRVLDRADPLHPVDLGTVTLSGDRIDAMVGSAGFLHVLMEASGDVDEVALVTYDVSDPLVPVETDRQILASESGIAGLTLASAGDLLLAATSDGRVRAFDLADPAHPAMGWSLPHRSDRIVFTENLLLVATDTAIHTYPLTDPSTPPERIHERRFVPRLDLVAGEGAMQIVQQYGSESEWIAGLDVSNPLVPQLGPWLDTDCSGLLIAGDGLALMKKADHGYRVIDYRQAQLPVLAGSITDGTDVAGSAAVGADVAAVEFGVAGGGLDMRIFDLADPYHPVQRGRAGFGRPCAIDGRTLLSYESSLVGLVDLSDLDDPAPIGWLSLEAGTELIQCRIGDGFAYLLTGFATEPRHLRVIEIQGPEGPRWVADLELGYTARDMALAGPRLYLASNQNVYVFDVTEPGQPDELTTFPFSSQMGRGIAVNGDQLTCSGWLFIWRDDTIDTTDIPDGAQLARVLLGPAQPNPFNPGTTLAFTVDRDRDLAVTVHDVRGRLVAELARGTFAAGRHVVTWRGTDTAGHAAASGVYLVRLHGPGVESSRAVTLVK